MVSIAESAASANMVSPHPRAPEPPRMTTNPAGEPLPKAYDPRQVEGRLYEWWERSGYFRAAPDPDREPFTIIMPPPNVTGELHLGHAMTAAIEDALTRYHAHEGRRCPLPAGHRPRGHRHAGRRRAAARGGGADAPRHRTRGVPQTYLGVGGQDRRHDRQPAPQARRVVRLGSARRSRWTKARPAPFARRSRTSTTRGSSTAASG